MRGLLAIEPLYNQIVAGRKTQTRRSGGLDAVNINPDAWERIGHIVSYIGGQGNPSVNEITFRTIDYIPSGDIAGKFEKTCKPRYKVGEVLYLKEPTLKNREDWQPNTGNIIYKYDQTDVFVRAAQWNNKLFMPASAARAFIKITGIRCERLLDISDADCLAEGIEVVTGTRNAYKIYTAKPKEGLLQQFSITPHESFISLYKFANKVKEVPNLWVWVYEFEYLKDYKYAPEQH